MLTCGKWNLERGNIVAVIPMHIINWAWHSLGGAYMKLRMINALSGGSAILPICFRVEPKHVAIGTGILGNVLDNAFFSL